MSISVTFRLSIQYWYYIRTDLCGGSHVFHMDYAIGEICTLLMPGAAAPRHPLLQDETGGDAPCIGRRVPLPRRGRCVVCVSLPRVALRPRRRGLRSTRGYMPAPRWGVEAACTSFCLCLSLCSLCPTRRAMLVAGELPSLFLAQRSFTLPPSPCTLVPTGQLPLVGPPSAAHTPLFSRRILGQMWPWRCHRWRGSRIAS